MFTGAEFVPASTQIAAFNEGVARYPTQLERAYKRNTSRLRTRWLAALQVEPPAAKNFYVLPWKTAKQRAAFFASDGFGGGIPSTRTHGLIKAMHVLFEPIQNGGSIRAYNDSPKAIFVYGDFDTPRQPMFDAAAGGIPWLDMNEVNFRFASEAEEVLAQTILTFSPFAGIPQT